MSHFGYEQLDLPILDCADNFLIKAGDQIINQLFVFERLGQQVALRPEFTASAAHLYAKSSASGECTRWQFNGEVFENNSKNEYQRYSIGAELIGQNGILADAEIIALATTGLRKLGINEFRLSIGNAELTKLLLDTFDLDTRTQRFILQEMRQHITSGKILDDFDQYYGEDEIIRHIHTGPIDSSISIGNRTWKEVTDRISQKDKRRNDRGKFVKAVTFFDDWRSITGDPAQSFKELRRLVILRNSDLIQKLADWEKTIQLLSNFDVPESVITIKPDLARDWEYYTGIVFELAHEGLIIGGGGRYDDLIQLISGSVNAAAIGFAYYGDELIQILPNPPVEPIVISIVYPEGNVAPAISWANRLRDQDMNVTLKILSGNLVMNARTIYVDSPDVVSYLDRRYDAHELPNLLNELKKS